MRALFLAAVLSLPAAAQPPLRPEPLTPVEDAFAAGRFADVVRALQDGGVSRLPRRSRARAYDLLGSSHERLGQTEMALRVYQLAQGLYPKDINILSGLAGILHRNGLDQRAQAHYERILAIHPNNSAANRGLAEIRRSQGLLDESAAHFERALDETKNDAGLWRDYGETLAEEKLLDKAADAFRRSLAIARGPDALLDLALLERRRGDRAEASRLLDEAERSQPEPALAGLRALWLLEDGQTARASAAAEAALRADALDPLARWVRASVAIRSGNLPAARADLEAAAAQQEQPFIAQISAAMLEQIAQGSRR
ncbi:MAG TPA: tetratricopeptide repeat protein [Elusimicrobiota bacterium]|jgi:tetratricopeptide (TPR) repeat protein|nr:tetratricopeptide repeat protein [Elusimicrobiota bacterium]